MGMNLVSFYSATFSITYGTGPAQSTLWAMAVQNATTAYCLSLVWQADGTSKHSNASIAFKALLLKLSGGQTMIESGDPDQSPMKHGLAPSYLSLLVLNIFALQKCGLHLD